MGYQSRLNSAYEKALHLPLDSCSKYILMSDCHRGVGTSSDNFLKNQNLFFASLSYYYRNDFTYIELGDGDELWENRSLSPIIEIHDNTFWIMSQFYKENRMYMVYGNHDICKRNPRFLKRNCENFSCHRKTESLFPGLCVHEAILLENQMGGRDILCTHGHQADILNSVFWRLARFLVRYVWKPLENLGVLDPTSAAKNNTKKDTTEKRLTSFAGSIDHSLIAGHTHRPMCPADAKDLYFNTGSSVHPRCITGIEIEGDKLTLIKWTVESRPDMSLYVGRQELATTSSLSVSHSL